MDTGDIGTLDRQTVSQLLTPELFDPILGIEEEKHPWAVKSMQDWDFPLLRIWDHSSGSIPGMRSEMLSRAPRMPLDTRQIRETSLATHLHHKTWEPTPYISFKQSAAEISDLANWRQGRRGRQTLTAIDPLYRLELGLPILDVSAEMEYYSIMDPYRKGNQYYNDHYVCLWEVTSEEIVDEWPWRKLADTDDWYEKIVMPEYRRYRERMSAAHAPSPTPAPAPISAFDMSAFAEHLPGTSSTTRTWAPLTVIAAETSTPQGLHREDEDDDKVFDLSESYDDTDGSSDSDNEAEEAN